MTTSTPTVNTVVEAISKGNAAFVVGALLALMLWFSHEERMEEMQRSSQVIRSLLKANQQCTGSAVPMTLMTPDEALLLEDAVNQYKSPHHEGR